MTLDTQFVTVAAMAASGAALGLLFDAYRVVSGEFRFPRWIIPPLDIIYWLVVTVAVFRILYLTNGGEVRIYIFLSLMIGVSFYFGLLSGVFVQLIRWLLRRMKQLFRFTIGIGNLLVVKPLVAMYRLTLVIFGFLATMSIFLAKLMLQLLYPLRKVALWMSRMLGRHMYAFIRGDRWLLPTGRFLSGLAERIGLWRKRE